MFYLELLLTDINISNCLHYRYINLKLIPILGHNALRFISKMQLIDKNPYYFGLLYTVEV